MKKIIIAMLIGLLIIVLSGCSDNRNDSENVEAKVKDVITQFYKDRLSLPGTYEIEIFKIKPLGENFMAVAQWREEEGQPSLDLLLIQKKGKTYSVSKAGFGSIAISMGFSVNCVTYNNKTIIFGSLKDSTWIPETDERRKVNYAEVKAVLDSGKSILEKVKGDKVYLLIIDEVSGLKELTFYNEKGQVEGTFKDLGIQIKDVDFRDISQQESRKYTVNLAGIQLGMSKAEVTKILGHNFKESFMEPDWVELKYGDGLSVILGPHGSPIREVIMVIVSNDKYLSNLGVKTGDNINDALKIYRNKYTEHISKHTNEKVTGMFEIEEGVVLRFNFPIEKELSKNTTIESIVLAYTGCYYL